jgi:hypothetical protein
MGILLAWVCQGRYHSQEGMEPCHGQLARRERWRWLRQGRGGDGDDTLNTRVEPHDTDAAEALFRRDADERKGAPREGMGGIGHRDGVCR